MALQFYKDVGSIKGVFNCTKSVPFNKKPRENQPARQPQPIPPQPPAPTNASPAGPGGRSPPPQRGGPGPGSEAADEKSSTRQADVARFRAPCGARVGVFCYRVCGGQVVSCFCSRGFPEVLISTGLLGSKSANGLFFPLTYHRSDFDSGKIMGPVFGFHVPCGGGVWSPLRGPQKTRHLTCW